MAVSLMVFLILSSIAIAVHLLIQYKKQKSLSHEHKEYSSHQELKQAVIEPDLEYDAINYSGSNIATFQESKSSDTLEASKKAPAREEDQLELFPKCIESEEIESSEYSRPLYEELITLIKLARYDEAIDTLNTAIETGDQLESGTAITSLAICNKAIHFNPYCAEIWYIKGLIYLQLRRYEDAFYPLKRAVELRLDYIDELYYIATTSLLSYDDKRRLKYLCQELCREWLYKAMVKYSKALDTFWDDAHLEYIAREAALLEPIELPL